MFLVSLNSVDRFTLSPIARVETTIGELEFHGAIATRIGKSSPNDFSVALGIPYKGERKHYRFRIGLNPKLNLASVEPSECLTNLVEAFESLLTHPSVVKSSGRIGYQGRVTRRYMTTQFSQMLFGKDTKSL